MSFGETIFLGAVAGFTIYLGLPLGRMSVVGPRARVCLAMFAVGILAFIFVDVLSHAKDIVETAVNRLHGPHGSAGTVVGDALLLAIGFGLGSGGLAVVERLVGPSAAPRPSISGAATAAATDSQTLHLEIEAQRRALHRGLTIASAIGLHNFAEGLAIGVAARAGAISLATVLIVGFALHNATEGFGIVGPLGDAKPSWRWLGFAGLIGGGPTFIGSLVGWNVTSTSLELLFYALAGGAIFYVIGEVWMGMRRFGHRELGLWLMTAGFVVGVATDLIVAYGGA